MPTSPHSITRMAEVYAYLQDSRGELLESGTKLLHASQKMTNPEQQKEAATEAKRMIRFANMCDEMKDTTKKEFAQLTLT